MPIVQSYGALQTYGGRVAPYGNGGMPRSDVPDRTSSLTQVIGPTYAAIYRSQPNVRTVVDFIARNVAMLGIHVFRRVSDTDRERLADHELSEWLTYPNPDTTAYRLIEMLLQDLGIFGVAYWLKVRLRDRIGLVRLPPLDVLVTGWLMPTGFEWTKPDGSVVPLATRDMVFFRYFNPDDPLGGLSPLETLRPLLTEDAAAHAYRRAYWANAARLEGVITRPATAPKWTPEQKQSFREQWQARYAGQPGQTAVLEDGMEFTATSYSARESELTATRKLTREEVAAAYHVPLPMVGILDHATFSNIREQHKHLYQDCLGPSCEMIQQEIERQVLPECDDRRNVYVEFNMAAKLQGSFEEQSDAMHTAIGRPWMTPNEGRARLNLPSVKDDPTADQIALPLNMSGGGAPDAAASSTPPPVAGSSPPVRGGSATTAAGPDIVPIIRATWARQRDRIDKHPIGWTRAAAFDVARWDRELAADLEPAYRLNGIDPDTAARRAAHLARLINGDTLQLLVARQHAFTDAREAGFYVDEFARP